MSGQLSLESIEYTRATVTKSEPTIDPSADNTAANDRESPAGWDAHEVKRRILAQGAALGFDKLAVTDTDLSKEAPHVLSWLAEGFAGDMGYLERHVDKRLQPSLLEPSTCPPMINDGHDLKRDKQVSQTEHLNF